ncbi:hypothetical protein J0S82_016623 [Galemys pyrenaicus]|uniref:Uncharacterized protein n=1 Tax=Galemys pyrenaicus TaxID=202257 RepID=A0A8J6AML6_GALPY|nr:hypothetical protein J0S82_016623 [Galemys pyrenaicus]
MEAPAERPLASPSLPRKLDARPAADTYSPLNSPARETGSADSVPSAFSHQKRPSTASPPLPRPPLRSFRPCRGVTSRLRTAPPPGPRIDHDRHVCRYSANLDVTFPSSSSSSPSSPRHARLPSGRKCVTTYRKCFPRSLAEVVVLPGPGGCLLAWPLRRPPSTEASAGDPVTALLRLADGSPLVERLMRKHFSPAETPLLSDPPSPSRPHVSANGVIVIPRCGCWLAPEGVAAAGCCAEDTILEVMLENRSHLVSATWARRAPAVPPSS